jgi:excisionase family DNA binding protein
MKIPPTQFDARENTASHRQDASNPAIEVPFKLPCVHERNPAPQMSATDPDAIAVSFANRSNAAQQHAATEERNPDQLLTVREVAELLQVPVSWVYGRVRKRSGEQLPGYRLGKYWRFREDEVLTWVQSLRGGSHAT